MPHRKFFQALPDAAILTDSEGIIRAWNDGAKRLFGWTESEMIGQPIAKRFPDTIRPYVSEYMQRFHSEEDWDGEFQDYRKDGSRVWLEMHIHPVRDHSGAVTGILSVSREIPSNLTDAFERERDNRYATDILNSMSAHVAVVDGEGRIREVNRAWERFASQNMPSGCKPTSTGVGMNYLEVCRSCSNTNDEASLAADGIEEVLQGKRSFFLLEYPCDSPTESRWFAMNVTPLTTKKGGAVVAHYDITARKKAELAVVTKNRQMELVLTAAHMGVWTLTLRTQMLEWSAEVYKIVGVTKFDGTMEAWYRIVHPEDRSRMQIEYHGVIERRMPFVGEFRIIKPDGEIRWLSNVVQVECDPTGEVVTMVGTVQDVTARKRSEWALISYNQILEQIASGAKLHIILEEVVRLVEEQLPGSLCSVLIVDKINNRLRFGAGQSLPTVYNQAIDGVTIGPKVGSCGTAAFRKATVTVTDIATDPLWEDYRDLALQHGLRSCVSVPIFSSGNIPGHEKGEVIGTFALYNRTPGDFDRLTYAILTGAEQLVRRAVQAEQDTDSEIESESSNLIRATHLAGVVIERDQANQTIRQSEERFRAVFDWAPSAIFVRDLEGKYLFVNKAMATLFGVPQADWVGKKASEVMPKELSTICDHDSQLARERNGFVTNKHVCQIGTKNIHFLATHFLLYSDSQPYAVCGILGDITELVAAQQEFERLWLHAPDPVCVASFDGYLKQVNPAWSRLLGWTEEELLRGPYTEFVHPEDLIGLRTIESRILRGETIRGYENRYRCRDGSYRWFSWNAIPVPEDRVIYGIVRDVTEEKRLAEQFQQAQKMEAVGQLASGVAHDFNNLLTVINGYTELLLAEMPANDPQRDSLSQVLEAGQRATELTSQLLAFSRKAIIEPKIIDINNVVESSSRMLRRLIGEHIQLITSLASVPMVKIDPGQFEQVFMNLAVNARDAMPNGGRLSITTETVNLPNMLAPEGTEIPSGTFVRVSVSDTGTGMPPEVKARIFEPFFTTKGLGKGTGLGLATVYGIVRQAGGIINVESETGFGTTFQILLPAVNELPSDTRTEGMTVIPRGTETVLITEDEGGVRKIASAILENQGYKVLVAKTGAEALEIATTHLGPIHLLLTDVVMPDMGGRVLAKEIHSRNPRIRTLYMSGYTDDEVVRSGIESSKDWFIQKPFTPHTLAKRVRDVLDKPLGPIQKQ